MPTISVRISDEERKRLVKYGPLSETVRQALEMYVREKRKWEVIEELRQYQREHPVHVNADEIVRIIREGRNH